MLGTVVVTVDEPIIIKRFCLLNSREIEKLLDIYIKHQHESICAGSDFGG